MAGGTVGGAATPNSDLAGQIASLLAQASPATVPWGILAWWGGRMLPDAVAHPSAALTQQEWESLYWIVEGGALPDRNGSAQPRVRPLTAVKAAAAGVRADGPVPLAIADFTVAVPTAATLDEIASASSAGTGLTRQPALASLIEERRTLFATALMPDQFQRAVPAYRGRRLRCVLDPRFYLTNHGAPEAIDVDTADGSGFRRIALGSSFLCDCPSGDRATITIRRNDGTRTLEARLAILVSDDPPPPAPDDIWQIQGEPLPDQRQGSTGHAFVFFGHSHRTIVNPLILAEGFPGGYSSDYLYELFNQHGLADRWRANGYDLIVLGYDAGWDFVERSAQVAIACIERVRAARTGSPIVAGGASMGGLVLRYALARMEAQGRPHDVRTFFTIDTPHRGTYTVLAAQWFARQFRGLSAGLRTLNDLIASPANQQLMLLSLARPAGNAAAVGELRTAFLAALERVGGYPQQPRRLAAASGHGRGGRETMPLTPMLSWSGPLVSATLRTLPDRAAGEALIADGMYAHPHTDAPPQPLSVSADVSWEGVPGGQNNYASMAAGIAAGLGCGDVVPPTGTFCAVPTVSALDLDQDPHDPVPPPEAGRSPFHDYICCEENQQHVVITPRVADWLIDRVGHPSADA